MGIVDKKVKGFTIVELIVIIGLIGILAGITVVGYGAWRTTTTQNQLKSDLNGVAASMESARNFSNTYPVSVPATFMPSSGVVLNGGSHDGGKFYCIDASNQSSTIVYYILSSRPTPQQGSCSVYNNMTGWWTLNGSANDSSGNSNTGIISGTNPTTGQDGIVNNAYIFTAPTQNIIAPMSVLDTTLTMSAWIKPTSSPAERGTIISGIAPNGFYLSLNSDLSLQCYWYGTSPAGYHSSGAGTILLNQWSHVIAAWSGTSVKLYINGQLRNTVSVTGAGVASSGVNIGAEVPARQFIGSIDDARIYNRDLSLTEVQTLFGAGAQ